MMDELEQLKSIIAEQDRRIQRMEAVNEITNVLGRYVTYHSASRQEETVELFCRHTPGIRLIFNGHIYDGWEGVLRHFIYRMANAEEDLSGRLYWHDVLSPVIEVAEDAQSAKCIVSTHGAETGWNADGSLKSLWSWGKYRFDFLKEDGKWKIYRLEFHQCMNTPYEGKGWVEEPCYDLIGIYIVAVEQIDSLGNHLHVPQFFRSNVQKQILDFRVLDTEALGNILHGCFQFAVTTAQLLLQQRCVLRIWPLYRHWMK